MGPDIVYPIIQMISSLLYIFLIKNNCYTLNLHPFGLTLASTIDLIVVPLKNISEREKKHLQLLLDNEI